MLQLRHTEDTLLEVGIDEAGRGSFWGPLYAAAVVWPGELPFAAQIRDSKKLSEKRRNVLAASIKAHTAWGIGSVSAAEITEIGMTRANQLAFTRALDDLSAKGTVPERLLIDGCLSIYNAPWSMVPQIVEAEADNRYIAVAAASILAKVAHDDYILDFCKTHVETATQYDLAKNKGYGTLKHRNAIKTHGALPEHRPLFLRNVTATEKT